MGYVGMGYYFNLHIISRIFKKIDLEKDYLSTFSATSSQKLCIVGHDCIEILPQFRPSQKMRSCLRLRR